MLEKLKEKLLARIERDAVKSEMSYRPTKKSDIITETVYIKRSKLPLVGDWGRIYPPVNEDGSWNIVNLIFGGKKNLIRLLIILGLITCVFLGFDSLFRYIEVLEKTCEQGMLLN